MRLPGPRLMRVFAMQLFTKLFGDLLLFVYHCFDRIVIHGYLSGLSRPEQVVRFFFRKVVGIPVLSKEILSQRTADYQNWVEAFAHAQGRLCAPLATPNDKEERLWRLFHLQEYGTGAELPGQRAEVSHQGSKPPHPRPPAQPLHTRLLLYPR